jgi:hypothetical protein
MPKKLKIRLSNLSLTRSQKNPNKIRLSKNGNFEFSRKICINFTPYLSALDF